MEISRSQVALTTFPIASRKIDLPRMFGMLLWVLLLFGVASAQTAAEKVVVVDGTNDGTVFGMGQSVRITGTVKEGAISLGGNVIVEGVVEGDVATIGGSVIQKAGSRIGGDVIVIGGSYRAEDTTPIRKAEKMTFMYAGYEQEYLARTGRRLIWVRDC
jgi:predicted acyltransferase (DUF342 family)